MGSRYHSEFHCPTNAYHIRPKSTRAFDQEAYADISAIESTWKNEWWTLLACPRNYEPHIDTVVISVDGACPNNGKPNAQSAVGIFFHPANYQWNEAITLPSQYNTSQRAELFAGLKALQLAERLRTLNPQWGKRRKRRRAGPMRRLRRVVIKGDSEYLVKGMTVWINRWRRNGYIGVEGKPVKNQDLYRLLDEQVEKLEAMGVEVQFWWVGRENNTMADRLAEAALAGDTAEEALRKYTGR